MSYFSATLLIIALCSVERGSALINTCSIDEKVRQKIVSDVTLAVQEAILPNITLAVEQALFTAILPEVKELLAPIIQCHLEVNIGRYECNPAKSCRQIKDLSPNTPSDYYYIKHASGPTVRVYCDMTLSCGGVTGGWMGVTNFEPSDSCPSGLKLFTNMKRRCGMPSDGGGCASTTYDVHGIPYQRVCGKVIGYQEGSPDAFSNYLHSYSIDGAYVDGVSLTHGHTPRHHIWTFASAIGEVYDYGSSICPCINSGSSATIPSFVGNDYFCDTGSRGLFEFGRLYSDDPLWDGEGCGGSCCTFNNPPWFMKHLSSITSDDLELRVCRDQIRSDEDVSLESVELYVQ